MYVVYTAVLLGHDTNSQVKSALQYKQQSLTANTRTSEMRVPTSRLILLLYLLSSQRPLYTINPLVYITVVFLILPTRFYSSRKGCECEVLRNVFHRHTATGRCGKFRKFGKIVDF